MLPKLPASSYPTVPNLLSLNVDAADVWLLQGRRQWGEGRWDRDVTFQEPHVCCVRAASGVDV